MRQASFPLVLSVLGSGPMDAIQVHSDPSMVARAQASDEAAIGLLSDTYSGTVYSIAFSILGSKGGAENVLHETFMQLWRVPEAFVTRDGALKASLAINAYKNAIRFRNRN